MVGGSWRRLQCGLLLYMIISAVGVVDRGVWSVAAGEDCYRLLYLHSRYCYYLLLSFE